MINVIFCANCKKMPIWEGKSKRYCEHCFLLRKKANEKYRKSHRKECYEFSKSWVKRNPELSRLQHKRYREKHQDKILDISRIYKKTSLKYKEWQKNYISIHKEAINERSKKWQKENYEHRKKYMVEWNKNHPQKLKEYAKKWRESHKEYVRWMSELRRERKNRNGESFLFGEWEELLKKFNYRCLSCGTDQDIQADHVIPLSRGGSNLIDNIQPLCGKCNRAKYTKIIDFRVNYDNVPI